MTSRPVVGVFALQGDVREHLRMLTEVGADVRPVRRPAELADIDAIVLPGGESTTMAKLAHSFGLLAPLQERIAAGMPAMGTCAGMILLADSVEGGTKDQQTIGGLDVVVRRNAFGRQVDSFEADVSFAGFEEPVRAVFIRAPVVEKVGESVEVLASADDKIVAVRQGPLMATSFHPEIAADSRVHRYFVELVNDSSAGNS